MAVATETAEKLYEGMFLLDSGRFATNPDEVTDHLLGILQKANATVVAQRPWLDGRLAYEIDGKRKGLHYLVYFRMPGSGITDLTRSCKLSEFVMRHLVINHEQKLFDAMVNALDSANAPDESEAEAKPAAPHAHDDDEEGIEGIDEDE